MNDKPCVRSKNILVQEFEDEILLYDLSADKALCLNQTSALVFQLSDGSRSVSEISAVMSQKLKTDVSDDVVWLALIELKKRDLLHNGELAGNKLAGLSRREAVRRVGLASVIMLPVISSIIAPSAASAASPTSGLAAIYGTCTMNNQCNSNFCTSGRCCVAGTTFAGAPGSAVCSGVGTCPPIAMDCCSGVIINNGPAPCGGAGDQCVCGA